MKKSYLFVIIAAVVMIFSSCKNNNPENAIIGKWVMISAGETESSLGDGLHGKDVHFEFKSNGTIWIDCPSCAEYKRSKYGYYKIDDEYFYHRYDIDTEYEVYTYSFDGNKFKISNINPKFAGNLTIYIVNVFVYERIK